MNTNAYTAFISGYKIFDADYTCRGHKYELEKPQTYNGDIKHGSSGFHFATDPFGCLPFYSYKPENTYARVDCISPEFDVRDGIVCARNIILHPLTYEEFGKLITRYVSNSNEKSKYIGNDKDGECIEITPDGKTITNFTFGCVNSVYRFNSDEKLIFELLYSGGVLKEYKSYDTTGRILEHIIDDVKTVSSYSDNGTLNSKITRKNGRMIRHERVFQDEEKRIWLYDDKERIVSITTTKDGITETEERIYKDNDYIVKRNGVIVLTHTDENSNIVNCDYKNGVLERKTIYTGYYFEVIDYNPDGTIRRRNLVSYGN